MLLSPQILFTYEKNERMHLHFIIGQMGLSALHAIAYNTQNTSARNLNDHYLFRRYKPSFTKAVYSV